MKFPGFSAGFFHLKKYIILREFLLQRHTASSFPLSHLRPCISDLADWHNTAYADLRRLFFSDYGNPGISRHRCIK